MSLALDARDRRVLSGKGGKALEIAMGLVVKAAEAMAAERLIGISCAHVGSVFSSGRVGLDFAELLVSKGARVAVPTTLNTGSLDLVHPELRPAMGASLAHGQRLIELYAAMGCEVTLTCAPYHLARRPKAGDHVAWSESNAVVFVNSVLGARSNKYGEFFDICAALTGRVPDAGLHRTEARRGQLLFRLSDLPGALLEQDVFYQVLGYLIGRAAETLVPVIQGLPENATEDQLRALGAAASSSGAVTMFHAVGLTPEAATLDEAFQGGGAERVVEVTPARLAEARDALSTAASGALGAVCLGTPHFSVAEFERLTRLLEGARVHPGVRFYVSTSRHVLGQVEARGWLPVYEKAGVRIVVDTCTYFGPILEGCSGLAMTNSAKWAYYAPGNLGMQVVFASMEECVRSAVAGEIWRDERLWSDDR
ncbi:MAG: aconitase X catalytic domain-containing protein [Kiloniellales bacterium]